MLFLDHVLDMCWILVGKISLGNFEWVKLEFLGFRLRIVLQVQQTFLNCSIRKLKSINQSESFTNFAFKTTIACLAVTAKLEDLSRLFCSQNWPFHLGLRLILYNGFDSSPPVLEVMIFIPTWPTIRSRMFNIPKRTLSPGQTGKHCLANI